MRAGVANGIEGSFDIEESDAVAFHLEGSRLTWGHVLYFRYFNEGCHRAAVGLVVDERHRAVGPSLALFMVMRVTGLIGRRVGDGGGRLHQSCFD